LNLYSRTSTGERSQFESLEEAVNVNIAKVSEPLALLLNGCKDVRFGVLPVSVGALHIFLCLLIGRKSMDAINEHLVECCLVAGIWRFDVLHVDEHAARPQHGQDLTIQGALSLMRKMMYGVSRDYDIVWPMRFRIWKPGAFQHVAIHDVKFECRRGEARPSYREHRLGEIEQRRDVDVVPVDQCLGGDTIRDRARDERKRRGLAGLDPSDRTAPR
jgi:hypothetical protein